MVNMKIMERRLSEGTVGLTSSLIERALRSDALRGLVINELEKRVITHTERASATRPTRVLQDQVDMIRAVMASVDRAMERGLVAPNVVHRLLKNLLTIWALRPDGTESTARQFAERHDGQSPPATMVISPTKACNLHCVGCYASSGMNTGERLEWDVFNRIITEAETLWNLRFFTISGGEPLAYRSQGRDLLDAAAEHEDSFFMTYTNGTLIDERMAERMAEAGNLTPVISVEGFEARTDERRGKGVFQRILGAMANLRQAGVPFRLGCPLASR